MSDKNKILIVEDELITATDMRFTLEDMGYEVVGTASTGEKAIEISNNESPDVVLMDVNLKGKMNGIEASKEILALGAHLIFLTGHSDVKSLEQFKGTGASGYVTKPFNPFSLKEAIENALGEENTSPDINEEDVVEDKSVEDVSVKEDVVEDGFEDDMEFNNSQYILVVEDEMITALDIKLKLEDFGYNVVSTVKSGEEAIEVVDNNDVDLVLMDITLKGDLNGIETTKILKSKYEDLPIIYLTANTNKESTAQAISTNPEGYIPKPFDEVELKYTIGLTLRKISHEA